MVVRRSELVTETKPAKRNTTVKIRINIMALAKPNLAQEIVEEVVETTAETVEVDQEFETSLPSVAEFMERRAQFATQQVTQVSALAGNAALAAQALAEAGFEGMELDSFSFTTICLSNEGFFCILDQEDSDLGKELVFRPESSKPCYVVSADDSDYAESFHSYDPEGRVKQDGTSAEATIAQWRADSGEGDDYRPQIKRYLDVVATIVDGDMEKEDMACMVEDNETVMLSIAPDSVTKFWGKFKLGAHKYGIGNFLLRASVGQKARSKNGSSFYLWTFDLVKDQ